MKKNNQISQELFTNKTYIEKIFHNINTFGIFKNMDNNILSSLINLLTGKGGVSQPTQPEQQNPAYYGYPKEAYFSISNQSQTSNNGLNLENLITLLVGNKGNVSALTNLMGKNSSLASIASMLSSNKKEEASTPSEKEILL